MSEHSRLAQLLMKVGTAENKADRRLRVPPATYLSNLRDMIRLARRAGVVPLLVTAPSNHIPGHEPEYLLKRHVTRLADVVPLHRQYVDLTRRAARNADGVLCDAANAIEQLPDRNLLFRADGIHFTTQGDEALAHIVGRCLADALVDTGH